MAPPATIDATTAGVWLSPSAITDAFGVWKFELVLSSMDSLTASTTSGIANYSLRVVDLAGNERVIPLQYGWTYP
jgi:hypothetical protein